MISWWMDIAVAATVWVPTDFADIESAAANLALQAGDHEVRVSSGTYEGVFIDLGAMTASSITIRSDAVDTPATLRSTNGTRLSNVAGGAHLILQDLELVGFNSRLSIVDAGSVLEVRNCIAHDFFAQGGGGAVLLYGDGTVIIEDSTLSSNRSNEYGGVLHTDSVTATMWSAAAPSRTTPL